MVSSSLEQFTLPIETILYPLCRSLLNAFEKSPSPFGIRRFIWKMQTVPEIRTMVAGGLWSTAKSSISTIIALSVQNEFTLTSKQKVVFIVQILWQSKKDEQKKNLLNFSCQRVHRANWYRNSVQSWSFPVAKSGTCNSVRKSFLNLFTTWERSKNEKVLEDLHKHWWSVLFLEMRQTKPTGWLPNWCIGYKCMKNSTWSPVSVWGTWQFSMSQNTAISCSSFFVMTEEMCSIPGNLIDLYLQLM